MKKSIHYVLFFALFCGQPKASLHQAGSGVVNIDGSIVESACSIDIGSRDQTIDMGTIPKGNIAFGNYEVGKPFSILLVNCSLSRAGNHRADWQSFRVTFDGKSDSGLFAVTGQARGIALQLSDDKGNISSPGIPMPQIPLVNGDMRLNYMLRLVGNNTVVHSGEYTSSIRFKIDYD